MNLNFINRSVNITFLCIAVITSILFSQMAYAEDVPRFSVGAFGGFATSITGEAVEDYSETEWKTGTAFGGSVMYRMANGLMFELLLEQFEMDVEEDGVDIGTVKVTPIMVMIGYQSLPVTQKGFAFHATIGGGMASSNFDKGEGIKDLENTSGGSIDISQDSAFLFELGAGVDYFFTKNIALTLDGRIIGGNIDSEWDYNNGNKDDFTLLVSNFQGLVGIRFWF